MKERLIRKLKRLNCPNEYNLDCKCVRSCPKSQMGACWETVFERYELLVSDEPIYKYQWNDISFAFKRKPPFRVICIDDDCCGELVRGKRYIVTKEINDKYVLLGLADDKYCKCYFKYI